MRCVRTLLPQHSLEVGSGIAVVNCIALELQEVVGLVVTSPILTECELVLRHLNQTEVPSLPFAPYSFSKRIQVTIIKDTK